MPESASARLGLIGPSATDLISQGDDIIRAIIAQLEVVAARIDHGTAASRPAAGIVDRLYRATDTNVVSLDTGTAWVDINAPAGTTLPSSPVDGQPYSYLADASKGVIWHLRYRQAEAGPYKWYYEGGSALRDEVVTDQTRASSTFGDLGTVGPSITLPALAGDFDLEWGASIGVPNNGPWDTAYMALAIGATAATRSLAAMSSGISVGVTDQLYESVMRSARSTAVASGALIRAKYANDSNVLTAHFTQRWLKATPVRVG